MAMTMCWLWPPTDEMVVVVIAVVHVLWPHVVVAKALCGQGKMVVMVMAKAGWSLWLGLDGGCGGGVAIARMI